MHTGPRTLGFIARSCPDSDAIAIVDLSRQNPRYISYGELDNAATAVAVALSGRNLAAGAAIALLASPSIEFFQSYLGALRAGLTVVPINYRLPTNAVHAIVEDCGAQLAVVEPQYVHLLPPFLEHVGPGLLSPLFDHPRHALPELDPDTRALLLYTSGSTGRPKGVPLTHNAQLWAVRALETSEPIGTHRLLIAAPTYHMNALYVAHVALFNHATFVLLPGFDPASYLRATSDFRCTWLTGVPTMMAMIARHNPLPGEHDLSCVRLVTLGSAPLSQSIYDDTQSLFPQATIINGYGTTEAGPMIFGEHPLGLARPPLSLGVPLAAESVRLRTTGGASDRGILEVRNPAMAHQYHNRPTETTERFKDGWFLTGDVVRRDQDGFFYYVGRSDDMFVCGGENIYPIEVEQILETHPDVLKAYVVAAPDATKGAIPVAFVMLRETRSATGEELKQFVLAHAAPYLHPRIVEVISEVPLGSTNKVDRQRLHEWALQLARARSRPT
jgi:long-chain acyl-CoA synthetase